MLVAPGLVKQAPCPNEKFVCQTSWTCFRLVSPVGPLADVKRAYAWLHAGWGVHECYSLLQVVCACAGACTQFVRAEEADTSRRSAVAGWEPEILGANSGDKFSQSCCARWPRRHEERRLYIFRLSVTRSIRDRPCSRLAEVEVGWATRLVPLLLFS